MQCSRRRLLRRGLEFHVCTINKSAHTKKVWKLIVCTLYIIIKACWPHRFLWISLTTHSYRPSLLVSPQKSIQCSHWYDDCKFIHISSWNSSSHLVFSCGILNTKDTFFSVIRLRHVLILCRKLPLLIYALVIVDWPSSCCYWWKSP